jgi:hypothetical protein
MAKHRYYLDTRVLTAFFFAAMPFVAFGSFIVVNMARTKLRESVGESLEQRAVQTKLALEQYVADQVVQLRLLAASPEVQELLQKAPPASTEAQQQALEQAWAAGQDARLNGTILQSPVAARLQTVCAVRPSIKQLVVVDTEGRVLAASARGGRLFHAQRSWFKDLAAQEGEPAPHVGDIYRAGGGGLNLLEVAYPVQTSDGAWLGGVRAVIDASDLYSVLAPVRIGRTGHAVLIRETDGMVLASDESERILTTPYPGFDSLQNALEGFPIADEGQAIFGKSRVRRGHWTLPAVTVSDEKGVRHLVEPPRVVGFSPVDQVPDVKWLLVVEQDLSEALAPIESVTRYLWIHFIGVFGTVVLLALYFSFKLERPVMEEDLHLHEEHVPAGMRKPVEE